MDCRIKSGNDALDMTRTEFRMTLKLFELVGTDATPSVQPVLLADADGAGA